MTDQPWPSWGLEGVGACPVCSARRRALLHDGLRDLVFGCALGAWTLYRCVDCGAAYLDPRPSAASMALAYTHYYTHEAPPTSIDPPDIPLGGLRLALRNGYLNRRYGYRLSPALGAGWALAFLFPIRRERQDRWIRQLPKPAGVPRLLDVGCGNGAFLARMRALGWEVVGVDPDEAAVAEARRAGLPVKAGVLTPESFPANHFDAITLNHVIEHLHRPVDTLATCHRILRPGGWLWIATPNLGSLPARLFGRCWRGLEAPRHLVIFDGSSLTRAVTMAGFCVSKVSTPALPTGWHFQASLALGRGRGLGQGVQQSLGLRLSLLARVTEVLALAGFRCGPELFLLARKPGAGAGTAEAEAPSARQTMSTRT